MCSGGQLVADFVAGTKDRPDGAELARTGGQFDHNGRRGLGGPGVQGRPGGWGPIYPVDRKGVIPGRRPGRVLGGSAVVSKMAARAARQ